MPGTKDTKQSSVASNRIGTRAQRERWPRGRLPQEVGPASRKGEQLAKETRPGKSRARKGTGGRLTVGAGREREDRTQTRRPEQAISHHQRLKAQAWDTRDPQKHQRRGTCTSR